MVYDRAMPVTATETALHLRALEAAEHCAGRDRAGRLLSHLAEARRTLVERHGARRVWLFGSLVAGQPTAESDVDLAVDQLPKAAYFAALADLMALFHGPVLRLLRGLLAFRHFFRHAYAVSLEAPRLAALRTDMLALFAPLEQDLEALGLHLARVASAPS